ncbi:MAG: hypothetical protein EA398_16325 [Deltaproteobacteria bacterium]|nr:MAG: hypothetical protein EA398_16325 [Deltaproteobacteria bacterium]
MAQEENPEESRDVDGIIRELEMKLDRLRALYDQYFLGIEKMAPLVLRKDVVRLIADLQKMQIRRTATRFRMQQQVQRFNTMRTRWARTEREIEAGTYKLHLRRAERREKQRVDAGELSASDEAAINAIRDSLGEDAAREAERKRRERAAREAASVSAEADAFLRDLLGDKAPADAERPAAPAATQAAAQAAAQAASPPADAAHAIRGMSAEEIARKREKIQAMKDRVAGRPASDPKARQLYEKLVATKRKLNESTDRLSVNGLQKSLDRQREAVRAKHNCRDVDFDVVVRDGKAFIKPIPKF